MLNVPNPAVLDIPVFALGGISMMRKEVENDESIKSKVQKQPIRQNPEVTLCCDVRCKIVGRSDEPNVYISNEQTTAAATLSFIQTSIS
ncbi:hypothetical protein S245_044008, partial [Arachis hypogaea]